MTTYMDTESIKIGTGYFDKGAWERAIVVARWLRQNNLWDGSTRLIVNEAYDVHYRLMCRDEKPVLGTDYELPDVKPITPSPHSTVSSLDENDFDAAFIRWALFAGFRMVGDTFVMARKRPNGRMSGWCMIWFVSDGERHLCDCNGPNVRAAYVAAERQMRAVKSFGSLDNMKRYRLHQQKTARNTSGLHEDPEDANPLEWCAAEEAHENPYAEIDFVEEIGVQS